ncbi:carbohydrate-binding module family 43 protein [Sphaerobolus stellatus SS14]|uniref:1,3-beta-glucanosyltransferase n=1 Tax=Sphaerobolus stellatus (strain SS14) TaxID=990650 RepID=A0A0C9W272_SPHS4|nr:carbohydrate-binding module family 43 protein [Sphaerobolus stellatus SS14]
MRIAKSLALLAGFLSTAAALPNVTRGGRFLYSEDGTRFYIKGISYQQQGNIAVDPNDAFPEPSDFTDPLADPAACTRDIPFLKQLNVNAIRVYSVNSSLNHDACMEALSNAGIYTIIDLSLPVNGSIDRASPSWDVSLLNLYLTTVTAFLKYDNVLAFNVGNEVVAQFPNTTITAPYIKAAARDVKAFLKSKKSSALVGYASTDGPSSWRAPLAAFLGCGSDDTAVDIYGLNNYEWCGDSSFEAAYAGSDADFANLNIPAYFSEFGCVTSPPRLWTEVQSIFGTDMNDHWSGGIAFSYFPAEGGYGMITLSGANNQTVNPNDDFTRLKAEYNNVTFINSPSQSSEGQTQFPACTEPDLVNFFASPSLPPTPNAAACQCIQKNAVSCTFIETNSAQEPAIIGNLLDTGCSLLGAQGGSCSPIGGNGTTGQYGALSFCDSVTKLDYVFSAYYQATNKAATSCSFSGNATLVATPPADPAAAATSCLSNAQATFTPSVPTSSGSGSSGSGSGSNPSSTNKSSAAVLSIDYKVIGFVLASVIAGFGGAFSVLV